MSLGALENEADLTRFIENMPARPRAVAGEYVDASTMNLEGRIEEADLAEPNTWLRLATVASRKVDFGAFTVTGNGASFKTESVAHNLGAVPIVCGGWAVTRSFYIAAEPVDDETFDLTVQHRAGTNWSSDEDVMWVALG